MCILINLSCRNSFRNSFDFVNRDNSHFRASLILEWSEQQVASRRNFLSNLWHVNFSISFHFWKGCRAGRVSFSNVSGIALGGENKEQCLRSGEKRQRVKFQAGGRSPLSFPSPIFEPNRFNQFLIAWPVLLKLHSRDRFKENALFLSLLPSSAPYLYGDVFLLFYERVKSKSCLSLPRFPFSSPRKLTTEPSESSSWK